jgi:hypothetical protein
MVLPNFELLSLGMAIFCVGFVFLYRERRIKRMVKCKKCGSREMRARAGMIICKNGHVVKILDQGATALTFDQPFERNSLSSTSKLSLNSPLPRTSLILSILQNATSSISSSLKKKGPLSKHFRV